MNATSEVIRIAPKAIDPTRANLDPHEKSNILCTICKSIPIEYEACQECQMLFCVSCIEKELRCPNCKKVYKSTTIPKQLSDLFLKLTVNCLYMQFGCTLTLPHDKLQDHEEQCKKTETACKWCKKKFTYGDLESHVNICDMKVKKCGQCGYEDTVLKFDRTEMQIAHIQHKIYDNVRNLFAEELFKMKKDLLESLSSTIQMNSSHTVDHIVGSSSDNLTQLRNLKFHMDICTNADNNYELDDRFTVFKTFAEEYFLAWGNHQYSLEIYDFYSGKIVHEIKNAHDSNIISVKHTRDDLKKVTYVATSSFDRSVKVWVVEEKWKNILIIENTHEDYSIFSIDIFYNELVNDIFIITSSYNYKSVKLWKFDSSLLGSITEKRVLHVSNYYNSTETKYQLIVCNDEEINMYDFNTLTLLKTFRSEPHSRHMSSLVMNSTLIECDSLGILRLWDIHTGEILKVIQRGHIKAPLCSLCLWSEKYLIAACRDTSILLYDISEGKFISALGNHQGYAFTVKVFDHWKYGKALLSSGYDSKIKFWICF